MNLQELKKENDLLKMKLSIAKIWMEREVKNHIKNITKQNLELNIFNEKNEFFSKNIDEIVENTINIFFGELMLLNTPQIVIENIISAEILFYNIRQSKSADGLGVISSYHKSIDYIIESTITKPFRKYSKKVWQVDLRKNDPLEKSIHLVVNKWYILWVWKLFHILSKIKNEEILDDYSRVFSDFLDKNLYLKEVLLDEYFFSLFEKLIDSEVFWKKRHLWKINYEDTKKARTLLIWDLKDENCLIYKLIKMWQVEI